MGVLVALSSVADGSMHNRNDAQDGTVLAARAAWLVKNAIDPARTTRLCVSYDTDDYCRYKEVGESDFGVSMKGFDGEVADALITITSGHALFLPVSDCIATTIYDPEHQVLMLTHLGRQSLEQQGALQSVRYLVAHYNSSVSKLQVWTSPTINKDTYKIFKLDNKGMKEAFFEQMHEAGIQDSQINDHIADTGTDDAYFSYSQYLQGNKPQDGSHAMVAMITR